MLEEAAEKGIPKPAYHFFQIADSQIAYNRVYASNNSAEIYNLEAKRCTKTLAASRHMKIVFGVYVLPNSKGLVKTFSLF